MSLQVGAGADAAQADVPIVEAYYDMQCDDCQAHWPEYRKLAESRQLQARFSVQLAPLPYHRQSYLLSQVIAAVTMLHGNQAGVDAMTVLFQAQQNFLNDACTDMTARQVLQAAVDTVSKHAPADVAATLKHADFLSVHVPSVYKPLRTVWKAGAARGVNGAPRIAVAAHLLPDHDLADMVSVVSAAVAEVRKS